MFACQSTSLQVSNRLDRFWIDFVPVKQFLIMRAKRIEIIIDKRTKIFIVDITIRINAMISKLVSAI